MKESRFVKFFKCVFEIGFFNTISLFYQFAFNKTEIRICFKKVKHPIYLRKNTSDFSVFYNIFVNKEYDIQINNEVSTIIDLGANIGMAAIFFKNRFQNCKIICVEQEKENFAILQKNTNKYNDMFLINSAIWSEGAELFLNSSKTDGEWGFMASSNSTDSTQSIKSVTLNQIVDEYEISSIDILKIDIEGSENELFEKNFQDWLSITKTIIIELHDGMRQGASKAFFSAVANNIKSTSVKGENIICNLGK